MRTQAGAAIFDQIAEVQLKLDRAKKVHQFLACPVHRILVLAAFLDNLVHFILRLANSGLVSVIEGQKIGKKRMGQS